MKHFAWLAAALILMVLVGCQGHTATPPSTSDVPAVRSTPLSAAELHGLYDGKTWIWSDGGAYFAKSGGFEAWSGAGSKAAYATGFWWVNDRGEMCFDGNWRTKEGANSAVTCFDHRKDGNVWFQRRSPTGAWYVFKSDPAEPGDEIDKLKPGDQIAADLHRLEKELGGSSP